MSTVLDMLNLTLMEHVSRETLRELNIQSWGWGVGESGLKVITENRNLTRE
jgi:hypothetical protein